MKKKRPCLNNGRKNDGRAETVRSLWLYSNGGLFFFLQKNFILYPVSMWYQNDLFLKKRDGYKSMERPIRREIIMEELKPTTQNSVHFISVNKKCNRVTMKEEIIRGILSFDKREPDKTNSLWEKMAIWLFDNDEIRTIGFDEYWESRRNTRAGEK
jgi:hypothetical protein